MLRFWRHSQEFWRNSLLTLSRQGKGSEREKEEGERGGRGLGKRRNRSSQDDNLGCIHFNKFLSRWRISQNICAQGRYILGFTYSHAFFWRENKRDPKQEDLKGNVKRGEEESGWSNKGPTQLVRLVPEEKCVNFYYFLKVIIVK